jgi:hypothetical protein
VLFKPHACDSVWRDKLFLLTGCYDPTEERGIDGRVVYRKRGDCSFRIQHSGGLWEFRQENVLFATIPGGCGLPNIYGRSEKYCVGSSQITIWDLEDNEVVNHVQSRSLFIFFGAQAEHFFLQVSTFTVCPPRTHTPDTTSSHLQAKPKLLLHIPHLHAHCWQVPQV